LEWISVANACIVPLRRLIASGPAASTSTMHIRANAGSDAANSRKARSPAEHWSANVSAASTAATTRSTSWTVTAS
jgi:hypothetical protein